MIELSMPLANFSFSSSTGKVTTAYSSISDSHSKLEATRGRIQSLKIARRKELVDRKIAHSINISNPSPTIFLPLRFENQQPKTNQLKSRSQLSLDQWWSSCRLNPPPEGSIFKKIIILSKPYIYFLYYYTEPVFFSKLPLHFPEKWVPAQKVSKVPSSNYIFFLYYYIYPIFSKLPLDFPEKWAPQNVCYLGL